MREDMAHWREVELGRIVSRLEADAGRLSSALHAELWASALLGSLWEQRWTRPLDELASADCALIFGAPLVERLAQRGGISAALALLAVATVDDGELGERALECAMPLIKSPAALPVWVDELGQAGVVGAAMMYDEVYDDARTLFLEARHPRGESHAVGVLIDNNLGGIAKDAQLVTSIADVERVVQEHDAEPRTPKLRSIAPAEAAAQIQAAIELTDVTIGAPVADDFAALRALALLRSDEAPGTASPPSPEVIGPRAREHLRHEFLHAPEAVSFASDGQEAFIASRIIDFCADYVDGRPLRWSPVVVELFMAAWFPRKVMADEATVASVPAVLDAWVRFAGRKSGLPTWAIEGTCEAIPMWRSEMQRHRAATVAAGPGAEAAVPSQKAGVDVSDRQQLGNFRAGWNAALG